MKQYNALEWEIKRNTRLALAGMQARENHRITPRPKWGREEWGALRRFIGYTVIFSAAAYLRIIAG